MATCKFTSLPCPRECKNVNNGINRFMRKDLVKHVKEYCPNMRIECRYCKVEDTRSSIDNVHANVCPRTPFSCPNAGCSDTIERRGVKRHIADCKHAQIACKYTRLGCGAMVKKKDMTVHVQDAKLHLQLATDKLQTANSSLAKKVEKLIIMTKEKTGFTFKIWHFQEKKEVDRIFTSAPFYTSPTGYNMVIKLYTNGFGKLLGSHLSVYMQIVKGRYDYSLLWPFEGKVTVYLLNTR